MKTKEQNPDGLHHRYFIQKIEYAPIEEKYLRDQQKFIPKYVPVDKDAEYFVLRLDNKGSDQKHIEACRIGIHAYANAIKDHIPQLAEDLIKRYPLTSQSQPVSPNREELKLAFDAGREFQEYKANIHLEHKAIPFDKWISSYAPSEKRKLREEDEKYDMKFIFAFVTFCRIWDNNNKNSVRTNQQLLTAFESGEKLGTIINP